MFKIEHNILKNMKIKNYQVDSKFKPLMIAEEGQANQGDIQIALQMAKHASLANADGIEYQLFTADDMYAKYDEGYAIYKERELEKGEIKTLLEETHQLGLLSQIAGLSPSIIDLCSSLDADMFVVNATDLNNPEIIDAVIASGKPFWLATLMGSLKEIDWAVEYVLSKNSNNFGLLHGQHVMSGSGGAGVPSEYLQLDCIKLMENRYELPIGFVDHTAEKIVPALAIAKGACVVTKHISPNKNWVGPDSDICLHPESWKDSKQLFDYSVMANGESKELSIAELKDKSLFRRSLHTARKLENGLKLSRNDFVALRPGSEGINPSYIEDLVGQELSVSLEANVQIKPEYFKDYKEKKWS